MSKDKKKKKKDKKGAKGASTLKALAANPLVADIVASALVATASARAEAPAGTTASAASNPPWATRTTRGSE